MADSSLPVARNHPGHHMKDSANSKIFKQNFGLAVAVRSRPKNQKSQRAEKTTLWDVLIVPGAGVH
jgi:hypothetical protein